MRGAVGSERASKDALHQHTQDRKVQGGPKDSMPGVRADSLRRECMLPSSPTIPIEDATGMEMQV